MHCNRCNEDAPELVFIQRPGKEVWLRVCRECRRAIDENGAAAPQPAPVEGKTEVYPLVLADIEARVALGRERYKTTLQTYNGRDPLWHAYQEAIDLVMYLRQAIAERDHEATSL